MIRKHRFILNNTKELHEEIGVLRTRVKQLEGALAELQAQITPEPHPLLQKSFNIVSTTLVPTEPHSGAGNSEAEDEVWPLQSKRNFDAHVTVESHRHIWATKS